MNKSVSLIYALMIFIILAIIPVVSNAEGEYSDSTQDLQVLLSYYDSINATIDYQEGVIDLNDAIRLNVPAWYKFVNKKNARMIVEDLWGNPEDLSVLGMIVREGYSISDITQWAFIVSYEESGYVKDEDADDIDYDEMLKDIQENEEDVNKERVKGGYPTMYIKDWATKPFYDKDRKILHWAKKLQFGEEVLPDDELTLNYDIRFLGRKGVLSMNAVGYMMQLEDINNHIPDVLGTPEFKEGFAYKDFNPSIDKVAAYTVGGLIAGKLLAKAGIFALILKNIKLILLAIAGAVGAFRKKIARLFGAKKEEDTFPIVEEVTNEQLDQSKKGDDIVDEELKG